jgi:hypothetical protein
VPGIGGANPLADRGESRSLSKQFNYVGDASGLVNLHQTDILGSKNEVVMRIIEGWQDRQSWLVNHSGLRSN